MGKSSPIKLHYNIVWCVGVSHWFGMSRGESYPGRGYWILKQCGQTINKHHVVIDHGRE